MTREEDKKLLAELMFVSEQLKNNIEELQKLDGIAARAAALNEVDTDKIMKRLDSVSFTQVERKIVDTIREDLKSTRNEISSAAAAAAAAAKDLSQKSELLKESSDSMFEINNMSDSLNQIEKGIKNWKTKTIYGSIFLSLFFGLVSGTIVSNISVLMSSESIENAKILTSKFGEIGAIQDNRDPKWYYIVIPDDAKVKEVVSFTEDGKRYIRIESKK